MLLGAHQSIAGGHYKAIERAKADGADSVQIFTKNVRGWSSKPLSDEESAAFRAACAQTGIVPIAHAAYLINLGTTDPVLRKKSLDGLTDELERCSALGIGALVLHPGSHSELDEGISQIASALDEALDRAEGKVKVLLEVTAGQGSSIGHQFEHIARIMEQTKRRARLGTCLDTCHLFAAGHDLRTREHYEATLARFDALVGLRHVGAIHMNDAKKELGSRVDRHEELGEGMLGIEPFALLARDPRFARTVGVLETPEPENYAATIAKLRKLSATQP